MIPALPADLCCAIAAAVALLLLGLVEPVYLFVVLYAVVCVYVGTRAFKD